MEIIEISQLPLGEKVYLKKDWLGWRVVHPIKNEDGTINWFNLIFGSKSNLIFLILVLLLLIGFYFGFVELFTSFSATQLNTCNINFSHPS